MLANKQDVDYDLALSLFETKFTIDDILYQFNNSQLITDDNGLVHFIFPQMSFVNFWEQLYFTVPPSMATTINNIPYMQLDTAITYTHNDTVEFLLRNRQAADVSADSIIFTEFDLACNITSTIGAPITIRLVFPSIINRSTGVPASYEIAINRQGTTGNQPLVLTDVVWNAAHDRNEQNRYRVPVSATITADLSRAENMVPAIGALNTAISFNAFKYNRIYGNIGYDMHKLEIAVDASSLNSFPIDNVTLHEILLTSKISLNGVSIPVRLKENRVYGVKTSGDTASLFSIFDENFIVPTPLPTDNPLQKTTEVENKIEANIPIKEITQFVGKFTMETNPEDLGLQQNILEDGANVAIDFNMDIPMHLSIKNYNLSDTIKFDMLNSDMVDMIHGFNLKMILKNAFPIDANISVRFLDSTYNSILTIYEDTIGGCELGQDLHIVKPQIKNIAIDLLAHQVLALKNTRYISVIARFDTKDQGEVKIFAGNENEGYISLKAGVRAKLKVGTLLNDYLNAGFTHP
jgi:hypothetical protein